MSEPARYSLTSILVTSAGVFTALAAGGLATRIGPWYRALRRPSWQPPDWAFAPAWTTIFVLLAVSIVLSWGSPEATPARRTALVAAVVVNLLLNFFWSVLFFRLERPDWALVEVVPLWLSIVALIVVCAPLSRLGAALLAPYLLWVSFAAVLNRAVVRLNGPFPNA
jgi:tryptophan-rich sensory protein